MSYIFATFLLKLSTIEHS